MASLFSGILAFFGFQKGPESEDAATSPDRLSIFWRPRFRSETCSHLWLLTCSQFWRLVLLVIRVTNVRVANIDDAIKRTSTDVLRFRANHRVAMGAYLS